MKAFSQGRHRRVSLALGCCLASLCWADMALAQAAGGDDEDEIVVTGSRVRGEAPVGSTVIALGRADIEASSAATVDRMIKEIPQNFDLGVSENSRGQSGGSGPLRSSVTRRSRIALDASGEGVMFSFSSRASTKRSIAFRAQSACFTFGTSGLLTG